jgi:hypothetical protein
MSASRDGDAAARGVGLLDEHGAAEVDHSVVVGAQKDHVCQVGQPAVAPVDDVVGVASAGWSGASAVDAAAVASVEGRVGRAWRSG